MAHEILNARPYAFLDDAPLEERRTQAVYTRRSNDANGSDGLGILDLAAIETVCADAWPRATNPDELHEALLLAGLMSEEELQRTTRPRTGIGEVGEEEWRSWLGLLVAEKRAARFGSLWVTAERLPEIQSVYPGCLPSPAITVPESFSNHKWDAPEALRELVRGRMEISGPVTCASLSDLFALPSSQIETALVTLETEGFVLRGRFHPGAQQLEWCDRRLLARIHRLTINRLRAEIQPVSVTEFQRFLLKWQRVGHDHRAEGLEGLRAVLDLFDGYQVPAAAWEPEVLALRIKDYHTEWLDRLCFTGRVGWGRLAPPSVQNNRVSGPIRSSPVAFFTRENLAWWLALSPPPAQVELAPDTARVLEALTHAGAVFFNQLVGKCPGLLPSRIEQALAELAALGWVTSDSFEGLRALLLPQDKRLPLNGALRRSRSKGISSVELAGRWSLLRSPAKVAPSSEPVNGTPVEHQQVDAAGDHIRNDALESFARSLLRRYGIVFRRLLERESLSVSWYDLGRAYRRLESRGEIRGGYFVGGISGEQFALPEAIGELRAVRKLPTTGELIAISGADPLNLVGILTPGPRVMAIASNRILFRDGLPIAALEAGHIRYLDPDCSNLEHQIEQTLRVGSMPASLRPYYA